MKSSSLEPEQGEFLDEHPKPAEREAANTRRVQASRSEMSG